MFGFLSICSLLLFVPCSYGIEYSNFTSFSGGHYTVRWKFDNKTEMFYFKVEVNATGWIGFGISRLLWPGDEDLQWNRNSMQYYDVIVGGVYDNGTSYYEVSLNLVCFVFDDCSSDTAPNVNRTRNLEESKNASNTVYKIPQSKRTLRNM